MSLQKEIIEALNLKYDFTTVFGCVADGKFSYENITTEERTQILAKIVDRKYSLHSLLKEYGQTHTLTKHPDGGRPPVIYALAQLIGYIKTGVFGDAHAIQEYHLKTDDEVVQALAASLRERTKTYYTLPLLVESYTLSKFHYKKDRHYNDLSAYFGIDFNVSIEKKLNSRSRKEKMDFQHHYVHLFNYMRNVLFNDLHYNRISDPHPKLGEPITENIHFYLTKHFPPAHHGRLAANKDFRHESILNLMVDLVEVLYFDKQSGDLAQGT